MKKNIPLKQIATGALALTLIGVAAAPAMAGGRYHHRADYERTYHYDDDDEITVRGSRLPTAPNNDSNKFWLDYRTDVSEAERELDSDLRRATDEEDRREAWAEYYNELRDAKKDYAEEMTERGYIVRNFRPDRRRRYSRR
ncbi:hypothetical protein [Alterisphingorhabdus coralli]|uniref:Uncharacterized protein n=1 Tax=Alterisphingorhabdus coralli TaxID=3071408 RepID=A0AA97F7B1_9SPHN|nr:hypothetical protein [Parasphingorhabdus sp. SCSIO 66989]WOE75256.1 hypothetical protein RB602_00620 [Parasphingorhabdus sp. SCSIO 66989]